MAKISKPKPARDPSQHSRSAKRGPSPPPAPPSKRTSLSTAENEDGSDYKPWLHTPTNAGISKKSKKTKQLTRAQKMRREKGLARADDNVDKLEKKVKDSMARARRVQERAVQWEELNGEIEGRAVVEDKKGGVGERKMKKKKVELDEGMVDAAPAVGQGVEGAAVVVGSVAPAVAADVVKDDLDAVT